ncbi:hypothetical protein MAR_009404 [Mya arenaria]|uniref:Uncharacterized protein n=1 Tax=Mya arenaria TaxID=6604 RepID=A0ABY7E6S0_MYAAR|nr:hypothetical protein MAR_009404 [Mya arenaria]
MQCTASRLRLCQRTERRNNINGNQIAQLQRWVFP